MNNNVSFDNLSFVGSVFDPYGDPLSYCGVVESVVQSHYQNLLYSYWGFFLLGGVVVGFLIGFIATLWWVNYLK